MAGDSGCFDLGGLVWWWFAMLICGVFSLVVVLIGFSGLILWFW